MTVYRPGFKSGKTHYTNRVWVRIQKSSKYRQVDLFASLAQLPKDSRQGGTHA